MELTAAGELGKRRTPWKALRWLWRTGLKLAGILSLVLFVAVAVFAVRSFWIQDLAQVVYKWYPTPDSCRMRWLSVHSSRGTLSFGVVRNDFTFFRSPTRPAYREQWEIDFVKRHPQGFAGSYTTTPSARNWMQFSILRPIYTHNDNPRAGRHDEYWRVTIPSPYLMLALIVLPARYYVVRVLQARARARQGLCARCGYDLRATPERCPECGTLVKATA